MMKIHIPPVFLTALAFQLVFQGLNSCDTSLPTAIQTSVSETDLPGKELIALPITDNSTWNLTQTDAKQPYWYMKISNVSHEVIVLNRTLDLENTLQGGQQVIVSKLTCANSISNIYISFTWILSIDSVNEFPPHFINAPLSLQIPENIAVNTVIILLRDNATDEDVSSNDEDNIKGFGLTYLSHTAIEAQRHGWFILSNPRIGDVKVENTLDFENFTSPDLAFLLYNISVWDKDYNNMSTLTIYIQDCDDQPPEFYYPGCISPCSVHYEADVTSSYTGPLSNIKPANIAARDKDALKYNITYSIISAVQNSYITINQDNGQISILKALEDYNKSEISLIIQAEEVSVNKYQAVASLLLKIRGPTDQDSFTPGISSDANDNASTIAIIVLTVVLILILVVIIIVAIYFKKHFNKIVSGEESPSGSKLPNVQTTLNGQSHLQTNDEDGYVRTNEKNNYTTDGIRSCQNGLPVETRLFPKVRTGYLPPIVHGDAEQSDMKHLQSRKEKRIEKELRRQQEKFDGTKAYPTSVEGNLYSDGVQKKSKIKLSSRKKYLTFLDPKHWITVDNDYSD